MNNRALAALCIFALGFTALPHELFSGELYDSSPSAGPPSFEAFDDDPAIYNNCNYCHGVHTSHNRNSASSALLNEREERYSRYLNNSTLSGGKGQSVFDGDQSRKCPRGKAKHHR